jgi:hypothetical protein
MTFPTTSVTDAVGVPHSPAKTAEVQAPKPLFPFLDLGAQFASIQDEVWRPSKGL